MKEMQLLSAAIDFFGLKPNQSRMDFAKEEWKKMTEADRKEIQAGLEKNGYKVIPAPGVAA